jgi:hypothetical protein
MLRTGEIQRSGRLPDLDAKSLKLLVAALASPNEVEALAALELLVRCGGQVPSFVLDHRRDAVVLRALELLRDAHGVRRLLSHPNPAIRAAALAIASRSGRYRKRLLAALRDREPSVRAVAFVALGVDDGIAHLANGSVEEREALARAIYHAPHERFRATLAKLLADGDVTRAVLGVFVRAPELADLDHLLPLLADPALRGDVRRVFVSAGARGLDKVIDALDDPRLEVRQHVPRTLAVFAETGAAAALVARLVREHDGTTERKILRALGHMRTREPAPPLDADAIHTYMHRVVGDAVRYTILRDELAAAAPATASAKLIADLLAERAAWSIEQLFRALGILHPSAGLRTVYGAIASTSDARRSVAREIFEHFAASSVREPVLAILDDLEPELRRARCGDFAPPRHASYEAILETLLAERSESLRCVVAYHMAESGRAPVEITEEARCEIRR